jgi:hypothetical protein
MRLCKNLPGTTYRDSTEVDLEQLREQLLTVVQETMQLTQVSLWLRPTASGRKQSATWISTPLLVNIVKKVS